MFKTWENIHTVLSGKADYKIVYIIYDVNLVNA